MRHNAWRSEGTPEEGSHVDLLSKKITPASSLGQVVDAAVHSSAVFDGTERDPDLLSILTRTSSRRPNVRWRSWGLAVFSSRDHQHRGNSKQRCRAAQAVPLRRQIQRSRQQPGRLNKSHNEAVGSAQSRLIPQGRRFSELVKRKQNSRCY